MNVPSGLQPELSASAARRIDHACDQFEQAWRSGQQPRLEDYLSAQEEPERSALLRELLSVELDQRRSRGMPPDDYVARFPNDCALIEILLGGIAPCVAPTPGLESSTCHDGAALDTMPRERPQPVTHLADANGVASTTRYQLLDELGQGAIGVVYRARDNRLDRDVALKVLRESRAGDAELRRRFEREARIVSQLEHSGIVPVYDSGELAGGRPFFTMKLVHGQTLATLLRDRSDPTSEAPRFLKVFEQVCLAVAFAHARGTVHRDLKPSNIMVGALGEVQVMDWGFAKVLATSDTDIAEPAPARRRRPARKRAA